VFADIKEEITRMFLELKLWVSNIQSDLVDNEFSTISRGLFFVYIYGIYEEIVRRVISTTIQELNNTSVNIDQCIYELYSLILSNEYDGLYNVGIEHKWEKRWLISNKLTKNQLIRIENGLFPTDRKNIRYRQLESLAKSFGIKENILPRNDLGRYIEEMVNDRNDISHGNKLPKEVGRNYTKNDLLLICGYISEVCSHIVTVYEKYIVDRKYLR